MLNITTSAEIKEHSCLVSVAALMVNAIESYGLDYRPILLEAGFDPDKNYLASERVSSIKLKKLWELSVHYTHDPCFGLTYASYIQPSALHGLGFSWLASRSLKDGLYRLIRFQKILATHLTLGLIETDSGYQIYDKTHQDEDPLNFSDAAFDAEIGLIYKICQIMMGPELKPKNVYLEHAAPSCIKAFENFFGIPIQFNSGLTAIEFDKGICEQTMTSSNPELARINDQIVIDYLKQFEKDSLVTRTREYIIDRLPSGLPKQEVIAKDMNMSLRNFQRKLALENNNYHDLHNALRYEMACQYLSSSRYLIIEISYLLGFSDPSNFGRAFKRWSKQSPRQFRQDKLTIAKHY